MVRPDLCILAHIPITQIYNLDIRFFFWGMLLSRTKPVERNLVFKLQ